MIAKFSQFAPPPGMDATPSAATPAASPARDPNTLPEQTVEGHPTAGGTVTSHPFSPNVKALQETLLHYAQEMQQLLPNIFRTKNSDSFDPAASKHIGIDPDAINKIRELATNHTNESVGYADGRWGQKTQDALNQIYRFIEKTAELTGKTPETDGGALQKLQQYGADKQSFRDIPPAKANQYAGYLNYILDRMNPLQYINAFKEATKDAAIPSQRDGSSPKEDPTLPDRANRSQTGFTDLTHGNPAVYRTVDQTDKPAESDPAEQIRSQYPYGFPLPFDANTNQLNLVNLGHFLAACSTAVNQMQFASSNNNLGNIGNAIMQYLSEATTQADALRQTLPAGKVAFPIDYNSPQRAESFLQNVSGESEVGMQRWRSENILTRSSTLCNTLVALLQQLRAAPMFVSLFGGENQIDAQIGKGTALSSGAQAIRADIERLAPKLR